MHIKYREYTLGKDDHIDWSEGDANLGWFNIHGMNE